MEIIVSNVLLKILSTIHTSFRLQNFVITFAVVSIRHAKYRAEMSTEFNFSLNVLFTNPSQHFSKCFLRVSCITWIEKFLPQWNLCWKLSSSPYSVSGKSKLFAVWVSLNHDVYFSLTFPYEFNLVWTTFFNLNKCKKLKSVPIDKTIPSNLKQKNRSLSITASMLLRLPNRLSRKFGMKVWLNTKKSKKNHLNSQDLKITPFSNLSVNRCKTLFSKNHVKFISSVVLRSPISGSQNFLLL